MEACLVVERKEKKMCSTNMMKQLKLHVNINLEVFENLRMYLRVSI